MTRLILLNGAPGVGKSTIARRLADDRPLTLLLDIDVVRTLLGDTDRDITASWLAARSLALAMAGDHLRAGHDVVVPQYLGRPEFIEQLASLACATDAEFVELVLVIGRDGGRARFDARGRVPQLAGADETWEQMHHRLERLLGERPQVVRVDASGDVDRTCAAARAALARAHSPVVGPRRSGVDRPVRGRQAGQG